MGMGIGISLFSATALDRRPAGNQEEITAERIHATITRGDRISRRMDRKTRTYYEAYAIEFLVELERLGIKGPNVEADLVAAAGIAPKDHLYAIRILDSKLEDLIDE